MIDNFIEICRTKWSDGDIEFRNIHERFVWSSPGVAVYLRTKIPPIFPYWCLEDLIRHFAPGFIANAEFLISLSIDSTLIQFSSSEALPMCCRDFVVACFLWTYRHRRSLLWLPIDFELGGML